MNTYPKIPCRLPRICGIRKHLKSELLLTMFVAISTPVGTEECLPENPDVSPHMRRLARK